MERPSKIGRLPANVREKLNHRLRNREQNKLLIQWLNSLPETKALLAAEYDGQPINAQNFSDYKRSGSYSAWLTRQHAIDFMENSLPDDLDQSVLEKSLTEAELDKYCWEWTKRPEVQAKLFPHRDPDQIRRDVDAIISHKLLGTPFPNAAAENCEDPACLI